MSDIGKPREFMLAIELVEPGRHEVMCIPHGKQEPQPMEVAIKELMKNGEEVCLMLETHNFIVRKIGTELLVIDNKERAK